MADLNVIICIAFDHRADAERLERFKKCICHCDFVETVLEVSGTFDMIVHGKISTIADYSNEMNRIRPQLAEFVVRIEANFVSKKVERCLETECFLWVPCVGGRKRVDVGKIDKILAEGDYMRLFVGDWNCLIHSTIRAVADQLDSRFIQLHRSAIVRIDFIDRLMHHARRWTAHLADGSQQAVAKSHVLAVLDLMGPDSSKDEPHSAKFGTLVEESEPSNEMQMHTRH